MIVLGVSASLRNARYGRGNDVLVGELTELASAEALQTYLREQTQFRFQDFIDAGRKENVPFDELYAGLRRLRGERGLSNSEAAVAAALWAAHREGAEIRHLSLASHFPLAGRARDLPQLKQALLDADAIIVSGPVYFGDRGSLVQSLIELIAGDAELRTKCAGKLYAGIAVGAKRNGGQETTLVYQLLDMVNLDFLAVGNSSDTTSQYGGTAVAGDVGNLHKDDEGIETSIGTGRRAARVGQLLERARASGARLRDPLRVQLWLLQDDSQGSGRRYYETWMQEISQQHAELDVHLIDATETEIVRCLACDICPTHAGSKEEYRCIVKAADDFFVRHHQKLLEADAVLLCAYSPEDRGQVRSVYQQFVERTRYLRRDNYVFSDLLMAPFVISELSARQNLHLRMLTSAVRHHTVLHHPLIGMVRDGEMLNHAALMERSALFVERARELTVGRYLTGYRTDVVYNPLGYEISAQKADDERRSGQAAASIRKNFESYAQSAEARLQAVRAK